MFRSDDEINTQRPENPEEQANFFSRCTFLWLSELFKYGFKHEITENDVYNVRKSDASDKLSNEFSKLWSTEVKKGKNNLWNVIRKAYATKIFGFGLLYSCIDSFCRCVYKST